MKSKAIFLQPPGGLANLILGQTEVLAPKAHEITVRMRASSLNYHDYGVACAKRSEADGARIPMSDGAGEVIAIGCEVTEFRVGDHVLSTFFPDWQDGLPRIDSFNTTPGDGVDGFARERVTAPVSSFTLAPKGYSFAEAATLTCAGLTAWRALFFDGNLKVGDVVLLQGTGGVSIFALQFAKAAGATVIATSSSEQKLARLAKIGADYLINYRKDSNWGSTVKEITAGAGVDHVIEVGGAETLAQSMIAVRPGGHIAVIGILSGVVGTLPMVPILMKQIQLRGLLVGNRRNQLDMIRAIEANNIKPIIDRQFALEEIAAAFKYQETKQHFGKICLSI